MTSWLADENFNAHILRGLARRVAPVDLTTVENEGMRAAADPDILDWAAVEGRIVLTHDVDTMPGFAYDRVRAGAAMPGVVVVPWTLSVGVAIRDLELLVGAGQPRDFDSGVLRLPL